jgi:hypothetical protein
LLTGFFQYVQQSNQSLPQVFLLSPFLFVEVFNFLFFILFLAASFLERSRTCLLDEPTFQLKKEEKKPTLGRWQNVTANVLQLMISVLFWEQDARGEKDARGPPFP